MAGQDRDREGGAIFFNNKKQTQNSPDYRGELRISQEVVQNLVDQIKAGVQNPMIDIAGWKKTSNSGTVYVSLSGKKPYEKSNSGNSGNSGNASGRGSSWPNQGSSGGYQQSQGGWPSSNAGSSGSSNGQSGGPELDDEIPF